jgi:WD40 repeat protein
LHQLSRHESALSLSHWVAGSLQWRIGLLLGWLLWTGGLHAQETAPGWSVPLRPGHGSLMSAATYTADGKWLVSGAWDGSLLAWDTARGEVARWELSRREPVTALAARPGTAQVAVAGETDGSVLLWDAASGQSTLLRRPTPTPTGKCLSLAFSPSGQYVLAGAADGHLLIWKAEDGKLVQDIPGDTSIVALAIPADAKKIAVGLSTNAVQLRLFADPRPTPPLALPAELSLAGAGALTFSPNSALLALPTFTPATGGGVVLWEVATGRVAKTLTGPKLGILTSLAYTPDGARLAAGYLGWTAATGQTDPNAGGLAVWDPVRGQFLTRLDSSRSATVVTVNPAGDRLAAVWPFERTLAIWDLRAQRLLSPLRSRLIPLTALAASADNKLLAAGTREGTIQLWDLATGALLGLLRGHTGALVALAISPDGRKLASCSRAARDLAGAPTPGEFILWDLATRRAEQTTPAPKGEYRGLAFTADGRLLVLATASETLAWDIQSARGEACWTKEEAHQTVALATGSKQGAFLSRQRAIVFWDFTTNTELRRLQTPHPWEQFAITPDGARFATASRERVTLWDLANNKKEKDWPLTGAPSAPSLAFSADGARLAMGGATGAVLWERTGKERTLLGHRGCVDAVAFLRGGNVLATAGEDGSIRLWQTRSGNALATLYCLDNGEGWLAQTGAGAFDASLGMMDAIPLLLGATPVSLRQLAGQFRRPDLLRRALAGEELPAIPRLTPTFALPTCTLQAPAPNTAITDDPMRVIVQVTAPSALARVHLTIDGAPAPPEVAARLDLAKLEQPDTQEITLRVNLPLPQDRPQLRLRAVTESTDRLLSAPAEITLTGQARPAAKGTLWLLAVGLSKYAQPGIPAPRSAAQDVTGIASGFGDRWGGRLYTAVRPFVFSNEQATTAAIHGALTEIHTNATPDDTIILYYAGYAGKDRAGTLMLGAFDSDPKELATTTLDWQSVLTTLAQSRPRQLLVLLDANYAVGRLGEFAADNELLGDAVLQNTAGQVCVSCGRSERALDLDFSPYGAFTQAFLEALSGNADLTPADGQLTIRELRAYVLARVEALTAGRQRPLWPLPANPEAPIATGRR